MRMDIPGKGLIFFEGQKLPEAAKHFELAVFWKLLPAEVKIWTLDLHYAWARWREANSNLILSCCDELEKRIYSTHSELVLELSKRFSTDDALTICQEWVSAINIMRTCAEKREICRWIISPLEGEVENFLESVIKLIQTQAKTLETGKLKITFRDKTGNVVSKSKEDISESIGRNDEGRPLLDAEFVEYLNYLKTATEEEQIAFIHRVTDAYTNSRL